MLKKRTGAQSSECPSSAPRSFRDLVPDRRMYDWVAHNDPRVNRTGRTAAGATQPKADELAAPHTLLVHLSMGMHGDPSPLAILGRSRQESCQLASYCVLSQLLAYCSYEEDAEKALVDHIWPQPKKEHETLTMPLPFAKNWKKTRKPEPKSGWRSCSAVGPLKRWLTGCIDSVPYGDIFDLDSMALLGDAWRKLAGDLLEALEGEGAPSAESAGELRALLGKRRVRPEGALAELRRAGLLGRLLGDFTGENGAIICPPPES